MTRELTGSANAIDVQNVRSSNRAGTLSDCAPRKKLIIIAHDFPPENAPGAARPYRFAKYLPEHGFDVHVVAAECAADTGEGAPDHTPFRLSRVRVDKANRMTGFAEWFERHCLLYHETLPWVPAVAQRVGEELAAAPDSMLLTTSPPVAAHLAGVCLKLRYGVRWIADFRDPIKGNPFRVRTGSGIYNSTIQHAIVGLADAVLTVTDAMPSIVPADLGGSKKVHVLWNGYDPEETIGPAPIPPRPDRTIRHIGTVYGGRHPRQLLKAAHELVQTGILRPSEFCFEFIGPIENEALEDDLAAAALLKWGSLRYTNALIPRPEAIQRMADADGLMLLDGNASNLGYTAPAKLYEYLRIGRPIIATTARNSPVERILTKSGVPYCCVYPNDSGEQVCQKLITFLRHPNDAVTPSEWFRTTFDGRRQAAVLAKLLNRVAVGQRLS